LAKILIRGGDLDLVEYEFQPFLPGQHIKTLGLERDYKLTPVSGTVTVTAPGRIHLTVLDMNRFAHNRPGGGGTGFALQIYCSAQVECTPSGLEIDYSREPIVRQRADSRQQSATTRKSMSASAPLDRSSWLWGMP